MKMFLFKCGRISQHPKIGPGTSVQASAKVCGFERHTGSERSKHRLRHAKRNPSDSHLYVVYNLSGRIGSLQSRSGDPYVTMAPLITYIRVSTSAQGRSGLGYRGATERARLLRVL